MVRRLNRYHGLMVLPCLFWAGNALVGRVVVGQVPPITLSFWRWAVALALILPFTWRDVIRAAPVLLPRWPLVLALSMFSVTAYNTLLYLALQTTSAINAMLVASAMPIIMSILAWVWLKDPIRPRQGLGILISLVGVVSIIVRGEMGRLLDLEFTGGDALVVAAIASWAVYSLMLKRYPLDVGGLALLTVLIGVGGLLILPLYLWELSSGATMPVTWVSASAILYTAIFPSVLAYYLWNVGLAALGSAVAGQYTYLMPLFTSVLAVLLLGEPFLWFHATGGLLIFGGLWLASRS